MHYQDNLNALAEYNKELFQRLQSGEPINIEETIAVRSLPTRTEMQALEIEKQNSILRLNSSYDPVREAVRWAQQYRPKNLDAVAVMFGMGNGVFLSCLLDMPERFRFIIVFEPSYTIFKHVLENYPLQELLGDPRLGIVVGGINEEQFPGYVAQTITWKNLYSQMECLHPGYDRLFPDGYQDFRRMLQDNTLNSVMVKNTYDKLAQSVVANSIDNIVHIKNSVSFWDLKKELPKEVPVIIVSAGPSLSKNIEVLKEAKGRAIIMAVDRAYGMLRNHGIEPDFIVHLDAVKPLSSCGGVPGFEVPLLCCLEGSQAILGNHAGRKIIADCSAWMRKTYHRFGKAMGEISYGGSVTTVAFALCVKADWKRIVLIGSDLAYTNGLTHAGGGQGSLGYNDGQIELHVEDYQGNRIKTRYDWYTFLRWFEAVIAQLSDYDIIDATEGGALIRGTRLMTLREVVDQYCGKDIDIRRIVDEMEPTFDQEGIGQLCAYLEEIRGEVSEIREEARRTIYDCQKLSLNARRNQGDSSESRRLLKKLYETNNSIEQKDIFNIIDQYVVGQNTDDIEELFFVSEDKKQNELISYDSTEKIYRRIVEACDFISPHLEKVIESLQ